MTDAIFTPDGDLLVPSEHARGPWDPGHQHGGAPAALVGRALERLETPGPMRVARLSFAFPGPVPLAPISVHAEITRPGRRLALAEATVSAEGRPVLRAQATLLRVADVPLPPTPAEPPAPGPDGARPAHFSDVRFDRGFHLSAIELRVAAGVGPDALGPALGWFRLRLPLVAGETPTPLQRVLAAADFGNGLSRVLDFDTHLFVNTDLTVHLHREPVGEWVGLDARTDLDGTGIGQATSVLRDERGRIGTAAQSLFVAVR
jgi:hypothetical protein